MDQTTIPRLRDFVEPAHPVLVKQFENLKTIYAAIREKVQGKIDNAFDSIARQVGYVVATSVPVVLEADGKGAVKFGGMGAEHLKDTLFEQELRKVLGALEGPPLQPQVAAGKYSLYLFWFEALKLKLRLDWVEPPHFLQRPRSLLRGVQEVEMGKRVGPGIPEPAHWFDRGIALPVEDLVVISVIDEVYPELRLGESVALGRRSGRPIGWGIREPAHPQVGAQIPLPDDLRQALGELSTLLRGFGY